MQISESFLKELSDRNDIADVVSSYVNLIKRSGSNMFGLCPFHSEKTPSFSVAPDRQMYHCFGCGKGGGVINFIMEIEGLTFLEAVDFLARRVGMEVPNNEPDERSKQRDRILSLNREAARFFYAELNAPSGKIAQDYVNKRQISSAMVKNFGLGFAPDSWDRLLKAMQLKGFSELELSEAGLIKAGKKAGHFYDTFRNRLIFPVIDIRGNVIGFSGRILDDGEPKYLNSPETIVFNKSRNLFAINLAKRSKQGFLILAEGNVDVIAMHQAGFDCAVASLGTSLTPEQARLMSRYTNEVIIAYDSDNAGQKATTRAIGILEKLDIKVKVLKMEGAKDPDEFIKMKGAEVFAELLQGSENHVDHRLNSILLKYNLNSDTERVSFLKEATNLIAGLQNRLERQVYSMRIGEICSIASSVVDGEVERIRKIILSREKKKFNQTEASPIKLAQPKDFSARYENIRSAKAEMGLISLLYQDPELFSDDKFSISESNFSSELLGNIFAELLKIQKIGGEISVNLLSGTLTAEEMGVFVKIINEPEIVQGSRKRALGDYINVIKAENSDKNEPSDLREIAEKLREKKGYGA